MEVVLYYHNTHFLICLTLLPTKTMLPWEQIHRNSYTTKMDARKAMHSDLFSNSVKK